MKTKTKLFLTMMLAVIALVLAACGGGSGSESSAAPDGPQEFTVTIKDEFNFVPGTLTAKAGEEVTINFENTGTIPHSFAILNPGVAPADAVNASEDEQHEMLVLEMHEVAAGETGTETFTAPSKPGEYTYICAVPGHAEAGMTGTLTVTN
jgi:plastocyanin